MKKVVNGTFWHFLGGGVVQIVYGPPLCKCIKNPMAPSIKINKKFYGPLYKNKSKILWSPYENVSEILWSPL